jgi:hypothetical protein
MAEPRPKARRKKSPVRRPRAWPPPARKTREPAPEPQGVWFPSRLHRSTAEVLETVHGRAVLHREEGRWRLLLMLTHYATDESTWDHEDAARCYAEAHLLPVDGPYIDKIVHTQYVMHTRDGQTLRSWSAVQYRIGRPPDPEPPPTPSRI